MKLDRLIKFLQRTLRKHDHICFSHPPPWRANVPFIDFQCELERAERKTQKPLYHAITSCAATGEWPEMHSIERYFLAQRAASALRTAKRFVHADKKFRIFGESEPDFAALVCWALIEDWNQFGREEWRQSEIYDQWWRTLADSWQKWLFMIWARGKEGLEREFRIAKLSVQKKAGKSVIYKDCDLYRCVFTLQNGTVCWCELNSPAEPDVADLHRVMIYQPDVVRNFSKDPPPND